MGRSRGRAQGHTAEERVRSTLPALAAVIAFGILRHGGFGRRDTFVLAAGLVVLAIAARPAAFPRPSRTGWLALTIGLGVAAAAAGWPPGTWPVAATLAAGWAAFAVGLAVARARGTDALLDLVVWAAVAVVVIGLAGIAVHHAPWAQPSRGTWRLAGPFGYANAAAALLAMALAPAAWRAGQRPGRVSRALLALIALGLVATLSRGGLVAGAVALAAVARSGAAPRQVLMRPLLAAAVGAPAVLAAVAGAPLAPLLVGVGLVAATAIAAGPRRPRRPSPRPVVAALAATTAAVAAVILLTPLGANRLSLASENRLAVWRLAAERVGDDPFFGGGPGTLRLVGVHRDTPVLTPYAHNEYLQALAETGLVGLGSIAVALGAFALAASRTGRARSPAGGAARASCLAFVIHSAVDFVWRFPLLVAVAFLLLAVATTSDGEEEK